MGLLASLSLNDLRNVRREPLLLYMLVIPPVMVVTLRLLLPPATGYLSENLGFDLVPYYPMLLSFFFVLQIPLLFGVLVGLLTLDERDAGTLTALRVTPISMSGYVLYRGASGVVLSLLYVPLTLLASGLVPLSLVPAVAAVALLAGLMAAVFALIIVAFASNKVEGLALTKGLSVFMLGPLAAYFVSSDWQLMFGVLPTYWPVKAFWVASEGGNYGPHVIAGLAYALPLVGLLLRRFGRRIF